MVTKKRISQIQSLKQQKYREEFQLFVVEGKKMVAELMTSEFTYETIYATEQFNEDSELTNDEVEVVTDVQMKQMSSLSTPPGVLAVVRIPEQKTNQPRQGMILLLDGINNPGNMGTIIRTADWFGISKLVCSEDCVDIWNQKVLQATMGSIYRIDVEYVDIIEFLKAERKDRAVYGALLEGKSIYDEQGWDENGIIIIGSESHGIRQEVIPYISDPITIPRKEGRKSESLNAAMAAGIIMAEAVRNMK